MKYELISVYNKSNPPWADKAVKKNESRIKRAFGAKSLPVKNEDNVYTELGCGHYGCVYETDINGKVLKITSDPTEIELVKFILSNKDVENHQGLVRYYKLLDLHTEHRGRKVYAILREEAYDIGRLSYNTYDNEYNLARGLISAFLWFAIQVREMYIKHGKKPGFSDRVKIAFNVYTKLTSFNVNKLSIGNKEYHLRGMDWKIPNYIKSAERAGMALAACKEIAETISQTPEVNEIGDTFLWFMCHGKLLADVHLQNIGKVIREENYNEPILAITDPGHAIDIIPVRSYVC